MNRHVSDIFYNGDNSGAFCAATGWDRDILADYAHELLVSLEALGVDSLPQISELVNDYLDRVSPVETVH